MTMAAGHAATPTARPTGSLRTAWQTLRGLPLGVWLAAAVFLGLTLASSFYQKLLDYPDEPLHVDMVRVVAAGEGWPEVGSTRMSPELFAATRLFDVKVKQFQPPAQRHGPSSCAVVEALVRCDARPDFDALDDQFTQLGPPNRMTTHPPAYYLTVAGTSHAVNTLVATDLDAGELIWSYRLIGVLLVALLPLLVGLAAREAGLEPAAQTLAAAAPLLLTGLVTRTATQVNNDNLLIPLGTLFVVLLLRIARRGPSPRRLRALGITLGLALLTKALALILVLAVPVTMLTITEGSARQRLATATRDTLAVGAWSFVAGGWWYARNVLRYGTPHEVTGARPSASGPVDTDFVLWATEFSEGVMRRMFERTGQLVNNRPLLLLGIVVVVLVLLTLGARYLGWRTTTVALVPLLATIAVIGLRLWLAHQRHGLVVAWHARYYFPVIVGLIVVIAGGVSALHRRWAPDALPLWTVGLLTLAGWITWIEVRHEVLRVWSTDGSLGAGIERMELWAPVPFVVFWLALCLAAAATLGLVVLSARHVLTGDIPGIRGQVP